MPFLPPTHELYNDPTIAQTWPVSRETLQLSPLQIAPTWRQEKPDFLPYVDLKRIALKSIGHEPGAELDFGLVRRVTAGQFPRR